MAAAPPDSGIKRPPFMLANKISRVGCSNGRTVTPTKAGAAIDEWFDASQ